MAIICITPDKTQTAVPHIIYDFLEYYNYLREPPCDKSLFESIAKRHHMDNQTALNLYMNKIYHSIQILTPNEIDFIKQVVSDGYQSYTERKNIKDSYPTMTSITVRLTDECPYNKQNGRTFYVFPASYSEKPVIHL